MVDADIFERRLIGNQNHESAEAAKFFSVDVVDDHIMNAVALASRSSAARFRNVGDLDPTANVRDRAIANRDISNPAKRANATADRAVVLVLGSKENGEAGL